MFKIIINTLKEFAHFSYINSGLLALEKSGFLKCEFSIRLRKDLGRISSKDNKLSEKRIPQPKTTFHFPLEDGKHLIYFDTIDDCISKVKKL